MQAGHAIQVRKMSFDGSCTKLYILQKHLQKYLKNESTRKEKLLILNKLVLL